MLLLEGVGDVLEEDEAEDDVLVLGRVHVGAELVGGLPELLLEAEVRAGAVPRLLLRSRHSDPPAYAYLCSNAPGTNELSPSTAASFASLAASSLFLLVSLFSLGIERF